MLNKKESRKIKKALDDELYTCIEDIEKELPNYKNEFKNKFIHCNCDDPFESKFFQHFALMFNYYKLKRLLSLGYAGSKVGGTKLPFKDIVGLSRHSFSSYQNIEYFEKNYSYYIEITKEVLNQDGVINLTDIELLVKHNPKVVGSVRKEYCDYAQQIQLWKDADIVVTNPPSSLFDDYIMKLMLYNKKFIILGGQLASLITNRDVFNFYKNKGFWKGYNSVEKLTTPDSREVPVKAYWYTNLQVNIKKPKLKLTKKYDPKLYSKYLNYNAIECKSIEDIPRDYFEEIGVPEEIFDWDYEEDFELIGMNMLMKKTPLIVLNKNNEIGNRVIDGGAITSSFYLECKEYEGNCIDIKTWKSIKMLNRYIIKRKKK